MQQGSTIPQPPVFPSPSQNLPGIPPTDKKEGWRSIASTLAILIAAPILALVLTTFVFQSYEVEGQSMEKTLQNHDRLIVLKVPRSLARITNHTYIPKRGEIVIFVKHNLTEFGEAQQDKQLIKRVIGLPGEHVVVQDGAITVYNKDHPEGFNPDTDGGYGNTARFTPGTVDVVVPDGQIFVCGDNRTNSLDSRTFGPVPASDLVGNLVLRLLPVSKAQTF
jgi:signal peptidase I